MPRLPQPGSDQGQWGDILNDYLSVSHTSDGSLKGGTVGTTQLQDNSIPAAKLSTPTQTSLTKADSSVQSVNAVFPSSGNVTLTPSDIGADPAGSAVTAETNAKNASIPLIQKGVANGVASLDGTGKLTSTQVPTGIELTANLDTTGHAASKASVDALAGLVGSGVGSRRPSADGGRGAAMVCDGLGSYWFASLSGGTNTDGESRSWHVAKADCTDLAFRWVNFCTSTDGGNSGSTVTYSAYMELADGTMIQLTFNGAAIITVPVGGSVVSDTVSVQLLAGTGFWIRTYTQVASGGGGWVYTKKLLSANGEGAWAGTVPRTPTAGAVASANAHIVAPVVIQGKSPKATFVPSVIVIGDSIAGGAGDITTSLSAPAGDNLGWIRRRLVEFDIAYHPTDRAGDSATGFNLTTGRRRRSLVPYFTHALCEYGTNDLFNNGSSLAVSQGALRSLWMHAFADDVVTYQTTISPRTTSTDGWLTVANQTTTSSTQEAIRVQLNAWLRDGAPLGTGRAIVAVGTAGASRCAVYDKAGVLVTPASGAAHPLAGVLEIADHFESARDSGKWKAAGGTVTGDTANNSATVTNISGPGAAGVFNGMVVTGSGIQTQTTIESGAGTSTWTLSRPATATATGVTISPVGSTDGIHPCPGMHVAAKAALTAGMFAS
jgi:hypothetical protein